jgi:aldehyde dehydrogenase (NAD+)
MAMKVVPALAAGNVVVLKPPSLTPFAALLFGELALEAGLPPGALNITPGDADAGEALVAHPDVAKISFTGGGAVARRVMETAARGLKPVALELGGKSANLVFADADLDAAAQMAAIHGVAVLSGQGCVLPTRAYVQDGVYDAFVERVLRIVGSLKVGDPLAPDTFMGPVISSAAAERILGVIERAKAERAGALLTGGTRLGGALAEGAFIAPTVFGDVAHDSHLAREEIFGPVLSITRFRDEAEAIAMANDSRYGLGAYVHTKDVARAHRCADALQAGLVSINAGPAMAPNMPFGGMKQSGFGREGGRAGLDEFLQIKTVHVALPGAAQ